MTGARLPKDAPRVLVVYKRSTYERYGGRKNERVAKLLRRGDVTVAHLREAHEAHRDTIERARKALAGMRVRAVFKHHHDPRPEDRWDLVVTLGGDGTLLWTSHMVGPDTPMVAINSAPITSVGYFCAGPGTAVADLLGHALDGRLARTVLTRMQVVVDGRAISKRILNDVLFCHECPASSTRYVIGHRGVEEEQLSSGLWVGPAAGSTAAQHSAGGKVLPVRSRRLQYVVREPYHGIGMRYRRTRGLVSPGEVLFVKSKIREGMLFLDGHNKTQAVDIGSTIELSVSDEPLTLLGMRR